MTFSETTAWAKSISKPIQPNIQISIKAVQSPIKSATENIEAPQGYWNWFKETIYNIVMIPSYLKAYLNIPHPRLIVTSSLDLKKEYGKEKFDWYLYDISQDNETVRTLRKELGIFGFYIANASSPDVYKKYINTIIKIPSNEYSERGFTLENDNSLEGCMGRLLINMKKNGPKIYGQSAEQDACVQLLWELEDVLWHNPNFNTVNSKNFIEFVHKMYPDVDNSLCADYLSFWKEYSFRFRKSLGLQKTINELRK